MAAADEGILRSWFREFEAPCADPWDEDLVNGRHRLWCAWEASPAALLPVRSSLLGFVGDCTALGPQLAPVVASSALAGLGQLCGSHQRLSPRYVAAVEAASCLA